MTGATTDSGGLSAREVRERQTSIAYAAITSALACVVFGPVLYYMFLHWGMVDDYSHGFLVAPLAIYFAWERRDALRRVPIRPSWWAISNRAIPGPESIPKLGMAYQTGFMKTKNGSQTP